MESQHPDTHLWEHRRVIVDVLEVDLHVCVPDESVAALVLREHGEPPRGPALGVVAVQGLTGEGQGLGSELFR